MTNEEAIRIMQTYIDVKSESEAEALDIAIKALETGEVYMTGEDYNLYMEGYKAGKSDFAPKQGEWKLLYKGDEFHCASYECSICQREIHFDTKTESLTDYPFCHCGAEMKGGAV